MAAHVGTRQARGHGVLRRAGLDLPARERPGFHVCSERTLAVSAVDSSPCRPSHAGVLFVPALAQGGESTRGCEGARARGCTMRGRGVPCVNTCLLCAVLFRSPLSRRERKLAEDPEYVSLLSLSLSSLSLFLSSLFSLSPSRCRSRFVYSTGGTTYARTCARQSPNAPNSHDTSSRHGHVHHAHGREGACVLRHCFGPVVACGPAAVFPQFPGSFCPRRAWPRALAAHPGRAANAGRMQRVQWP